MSANGVTCKCGAKTVTEHSAKVRAGYSGHVYTGFYWAPKDDPEPEPDDTD